MKSKKISQKGDMSLLVIFLIVILLILAVGYYFWQNSSSNSESSSDQSSQEADAKPNNQSETSETQESACSDPSDSDVANIQDSVSSGDTAALEGYMASTVTVILAASEGIGERTPTQAVNDISDFIGDPTTTTWNFDLPASVINSYNTSSYKKYFPDTAVVGKSNASKVISFSFDCDGKIETVFESPSSEWIQ